MQTYLKIDIWTCMKVMRSLLFQNIWSVKCWQENSVKVNGGGH